VLELGPGCGAPGLTVARYVEGVGTRIFLTDVNPAIIKNLEFNIRLNGKKDEGKGDWDDRVTATSIDLGE